MELRDWINAERGRATKLAAQLGISPSYLSQIAAGTSNRPPKLCVLIEHATDGEVARQDLRPDDWHEIWPELVAVA